MKIEPFALERWLTAHELNVEYDIAESGILPLSARDLLDLIPGGERSGELQRLLDLRLGYSEATGSLQLRTLLAQTYEDCGPDNILVTTGAIEANVDVAWARRSTRGVQTGAPPPAPPSTGPSALRDAGSKAVAGDGGRQP